jgi:peptide/nickel transport system substrate-binding protein
VVFVSAQEPPNLQHAWAGNNLAVTWWVLNNIWYGCQIRDDKADFVPRLCVGRPRIVSRSPLVTVHEYKQAAVWSDGRPVTARDFRATWRVFTDPKNTVISRAGWEEIRSVRGNGKQTTVVWKRPWAGWESVVSSGPYPEHVIRGKDMNEMFLRSIPVSSGPWLFESWQRGIQMTLVENRRFRAHTPMKLDRVVIRFIPDTNTAFQALRAREAHITASSPQLQIESFMRDRNFVVSREVGYSWEHSRIQFGRGGQPALRQRYVRKALITGINRAQSSACCSAARAGLQPLQSLVFLPFERTYEPNWSTYRFSQREVIGLLKRNGCTGGPDTPAAGNDRIWTCPGVGRLSFRLTTTSDSQFRRLTFEIIQHQLRSVGIELVPRFGTAGTVFGTVIPSGDWDLAMSGLGRNPADEIHTGQLYGCGGDQNVMRYCNRS